jgi:hypothetical protein
MNEFAHKISGRGIRTRTRAGLRRRVLLRRMRHQHFHRHHRFGVAILERRRTPVAAAAASRFAPCMSCTGHWPA